MDTPQQPPQAPQPRTPPNAKTPTPKYAHASVGGRKVWEARWSEWPSAAYLNASGRGATQKTALAALRKHTISLLREEAAAYDSEAEARVSYLRQWAKDARAAAKTIETDILATKTKRKEITSDQKND